MVSLANLPREVLISGSHREESSVSTLMIIHQGLDQHRQGPGQPLTELIGSMLMVPDCRKMKHTSGKMA